MPKYIVSSRTTEPCDIVLRSLCQCGGAHSSARPAALSRSRRATVPSNRTGAQTTRKRKAGARVKAKNAFVGNGKALNADVRDEAAKKAGTGFGKKASSKRAREERALAAERRLLALQKTAGPSTSTPRDESDSELGSDEDVEVAETDEDRRKRMLDIMSEADLEGLKYGDFDNEFTLPSSSSMGKGRATADDVIDTEDDPKPPPAKKKKLSALGLVKDEVEYRKKEALGMVGSGRSLGGGPSKQPPDRGGSRQSKILDHLSPASRKEHKAVDSTSTTVAPGDASSTWSCSVCTL